MNQAEKESLASLRDRARNGEEFNPTQLAFYQDLVARDARESVSAGQAASSPIGRLESADTSGHVSVSGGVTPYIGVGTIALAASNDPMRFTHDGKDAHHFLTLWAKVLKKKKMPYRVTTDTAAQKVCFAHRGRSAIMWFDITDVRQVRQWYLNFRLCGDDFTVFFKHVREETLEADDIQTPPAELDCVSKYK